MFNGGAKAGLMFVAGIVLLAAGITTGMGSKLAISPGSNSAAAGMRFSSPARQDQLARAAEMPSGPQDMEIPENLRAKQDKDLRKFRFDKMKGDAAELAKLSAALKEEVDKSNQNILSVKIVDKAEKIEKLARKIQDEAKAEPGLPKPIDSGDL